MYVCVCSDSTSVNICSMSIAQVFILFDEYLSSSSNCYIVQWNRRTMEISLLEACK